MRYCDWFAADLCGRCKELPLYTCHEALHLQHQFKAQLQALSPPLLTLYTSTLQMTVWKYLTSMHICISHIPCHHLSKCRLSCLFCRWLTVSAACMKTGHNTVRSHSELVHVVNSGTAAKMTHIAVSREDTVGDSASSDLRQLAVNSQSMTLTDDLFAMHSALVTLTCKLTNSLSACCKLSRSRLGDK